MIRILFLIYFIFIVYSSYAHTLYARAHSPLSYPLIRPFPDDPGFAHSDLMFDFIDQVLMSSYSSRGPGVSSYLILIFDSDILTSLLFMLFLDSLYTYPVTISFIHMLSCVDAYM